MPRDDSGSAANVAVIIAVIVAAIVRSE